MKLFSCSLIILAFITLGCYESPNPNEGNYISQSEIQHIAYGTSFGLCFGYCIQEVIFNEKVAIKTLTPQLDDELKVKSCSTNHLLTEFSSKLDLEVFFNLPERIGCPDCADGGSEWIEVTTKDQSKKVTYEYDNSPKELRAIISELKNVYDLLGECN